MAGTTNFGPVTLNAGTRDFPASGGVAIADSDTEVALIIDRTITGGLNSAAATLTITVSVFQSNNGGTTWDLLGGVGVNGGLIFNRHTGTNDAFSGMDVTLHPGTGRLARAEVVIAGGSVAVQGTLTLS